MSYVSISHRNGRPSVHHLGLGAGATAPSSSSVDMTFSLSDPQVAAAAAAQAVRSASATALRGHIAQVEDFQRAYGHGLTVDGIYGRNTRAALVSVTGQSDLPPVPGTSSTSSSSSSVTPSSVSPDLLMPPLDTGAMPSWALPVLGVTAVALGGGLFLYFRRKPVAKNRGRRRGRRRSR